MDHEGILLLKQWAYSVLGRHDKFVWKFNSNGEYFISSAYHTLVNEQHHDTIHGWFLGLWKRLWCLRLSYKIIIFLWKICTNSLPIRTELHKRIPQIPPTCPLCQLHDETMKHLSLEYSMSRAIWFGSDLKHRIHCLRVTSLKEWLANPDLHQLEALWFYEQFICYIWCIWLHRNDIIFNN